MNSTETASIQAFRRIRTGVAAYHARQTFEARLALDDRTQEDAFKLRYRSYLDSGFIEPNATGLFRDRFDDLPTAKTIVVYDRGTPVASVRACFLSRGEGTTSPGRETYPYEVSSLLDLYGNSGCGFDGLEVNRLVRSPEAANNQGLVFLLYRLVGHLALLVDFQVVISCARKNHVPFYRRIGFSEESDLKIYPGLTCAMQLLSCRRSEYDSVRSGIPMMDPHAGPIGTLDGLVTGQSIRVPLLHD